MSLTERASKVVVVTGASSGIGQSTAIEVARRGHIVYATMRDLSKGDQLARRQAGSALHLRRLDVNDQVSIDAVVDEVVDVHGRIDALVNNAGLASAALAYDLADDDARRVIETNFLGAVRCTRAVARVMMTNRSGTIINVSSIAGRSAVPFLSAYSASKFALEGWSESLRHELGPSGVKVCVIEPGTFRTPIYEEDEQPPRSPTSPKVARAEAMLREHARRHGGDPVKVARRIADVVDRWTRFRVVVGRDARVELLIKRLLPDEVFGRLMGRFAWREMVEHTDADGRGRTGP